MGLCIMPAKKTTHQAKSSSHLPTALVAGAAGFIGSHLCDSLIHQNCKVYAIDNWSTGKKGNLKHLLKNDNFVFLEHDLNKPFIGIKSMGAPPEYHAISRLKAQDGSIDCHIGPCFIYYSNDSQRDPDIF